MNAGYDVVVLDNLCNSSKESLKRVEKIVGKPIPFYEADIRDAEALKNIFEKEDIDAVIHFAGLKAVGESVVKPLEYYDNNIAGTLVTLRCNEKCGSEEHYLQFFCNSIWRSGICTDHRRMPERTVYKSIRLVEVNVRADPHQIYIQQIRNGMSYYSVTLIR